MKIGIFSDTFPPEVNGVATVSELLYKMFTKFGHKVYVITTGEKLKKQKFSVDGDIIRISSKEFKHLYNYRRAPFYSSAVYKYVKSLELDIIHVQTEAGIGIMARVIAKRNNIPLVYTYHTMYEDYTYYVTHGRKLFDRFAKHVVADFSAFISNTTTETTTTSYKTRDALRRYGARNYINVIPNGIDLSMFISYPQVKVDEFKKKEGIEDKFVMLILGRLAQEKSNDEVLHNVASLVRKRGKEGLILYVVGDGPDRENLENIVKEEGLGDITKFVGKVEYSSVPLYYRASDIFLSASVTETQGLTFIEAMASKTLVLAKKDECLREVIIEGKTGYFFENSEQFIEAMEKVLSMSKDEFKAIQDGASELVNKKYSAEQFYESMLHTYQRALRKHW